MFGGPGRDLGAEPRSEHVLVDDEEPVRRAHGGGDDLLVPRADRAQVDDLHLDAVALGEHGGGVERLLDGGAPRDDREVVSRPSHGTPAEGDAVALDRERVDGVGLAKQVLVLAEHDRIVAGEGSSQQADGIPGPRGEGDDETGDVGEDRLAALAVPDRTAREVTADRDAQHHRAGELAGRTPAGGRHLAAQLLHRRPDVVEELDLGRRVQAAHRLADGAPDDVRLGERRVVAARLAELALEAVRRAEDAALALHVGEHDFPGIGDVLAEHPDALVGRHLLVQRALDRFAERHRFAVGARVPLGADVGEREHVVGDGLRIGSA